MGLLKPATNTTAYAKIGIMGFQGSGKTYTASRMASGIVSLLGDKAQRKISFFDTETGSDFLIPYYKKEEIEFYQYKGRAFTDLIAYIRESEQAGIDVLIMDSISHVWKELTESYAKKRKRSRLQFQDWAVLKGQWGQLTDAFLNAKIHIIMCGRAGYEYDYFTNDDGKKELMKTGTKMKAETEFGYEPSLLIEMERIKSQKFEEKGWINRATILKDRSDTINGKQFDYPTFQEFSPFFQFLNLGGEHVGLNTERNSTDLFDNPDYSYEELQRRRKIVLEQIQEALTLGGLDGRSGDTVKKRAELMIAVFGTSSKTAIESMKPHELEKKMHEMRAKLGLVTEQPPEETL